MLCVMGGLALGALAALEAYGGETLVPDSSPVRRSLERLLTLPLNQLKQEKKERLVDDPSGGGKVLVRIDTSAKNQVAYGFLYARNGRFDPLAPGSVTIRRNPVSEQLLGMTLTLRSSPWIYVDFEPEGNRTRLSVCLGGPEQALYRQVRISLSLDRLVRLPLEDFRRMTEARLDWGLFLGLPDPSYYAPVLEMVAKIRQALPGLPDAEDGALDENGRFVGISTTGPGARPGLNCSGFAKWVADGLYGPLTGTYLSVARLSARNRDDRGTSFAEAYEEVRDPYFGLDWVRNIATSLHEARTGHKPASSQDRDVRQLDFVPSVEDKGFACRDLDLALFVLARQEPGTFYLASVNGEWGKEPKLWQHYHIVVLFPYFDRNGEFRTVVFERNAETSLASLHRRYPREYFHLVRIKAASGFLPPPIP